MPEGLVCSQCGGPLNEDYVCTYCGTRYRKPESRNVTINVTNNYNGVMPTAAPAEPEQTPAPVIQEQVEPVAQEQAPSTETEAETPSTEEKRSSIEEFVNNSFGLLFLMLIGAGALLIIGVNTNNEFMIILGAVVGALFLFLSSKYHKGKDDDSK